MKTLRPILLLVAALLLSLSAAQAENNWLTDFPKAQAEAKTQHKLLLVNFTGSDWCPWCLRLEREVFAKPEFQNYAKDHLVLFMADFPRAKSLSTEVRKQNRELAERFSVEGFPTIIVLNAEGKPIAELGYLPGGATAFVDQLKKLPQS